MNYKIPVYREVSGFVNVDADSLEEAINIAVRDDSNFEMEEVVSESRGFYDDMILEHNPSVSPGDVDELEAMVYTNWTELWNAVHNAVNVLLSLWLFVMFLDLLLKR